jgi:hypothetical protein
MWKPVKTHTHTHTRMCAPKHTHAQSNTRMCTRQLFQGNQQRTPILWFLVYTHCSSPMQRSANQISPCVQVHMQRRSLATIEPNSCIKLCLYISLYLSLFHTHTQCAKFKYIAKHYCIENTEHDAVSNKYVHTKFDHHTNFTQFYTVYKKKKCIHEQTQIQKCIHTHTHTHTHTHANWVKVST